MTSRLPETQRFVSTRSGAEATYPQTLMQGQAPDGGLYMPIAMPNSFDEDFLQALPNLKLSDVSFAVLRKFIPDQYVSDDELRDRMRVAHNFDIPVDSIDAHTHVGHLDQGETAAFKDIATRTLAQLVDQQGVAHTTVSILYPSEGVSQIQEINMLDIAKRNHNVQVIPTPRTFTYAQNIASILLLASKANPDDLPVVNEIRDKAQKLLNETLTEDDVKGLIAKAHEAPIGSANSINFWRLAPQISQYFRTYGELVAQGKIQSGDALSFGIPTGNVGHIMAGVLAREMGLPINKLIAGTNQNNAFSYFIGAGVIKHDGEKKTHAKSMDIEYPNNLERLLYYAAQKVDPAAKIDYEGIKNAVRAFKPGSEGIPVAQFGVTDTIMEHLRSFIFVDDTVSDEEIEEVMLEVDEKTDGAITAEPHFSAAYKAVATARQQGYIGENDHVVIFKTAHHDKFPEPLEATGIQGANPHAELEPLKALSVNDFDKPSVITGIRDALDRVISLAKATGSTLEDALNVIVATSGDTGPSVGSAFGKGKKQ